MTDKQREGLQKLKEVLKEYDLSIGFTCSDCSDTHGLHDDEVIIHCGDEKVAGTQSWWLSHDTL